MEKSPMASRQKKFISCSRQSFHCLRRDKLSIRRAKAAAFVPIFRKMGTNAAAFARRIDNLSRRRQWKLCREQEMNFFWRLAIGLFSIGLGASRACDLCGCYTPQLEAMPGMESMSSPSWLAGGTQPSANNSRISVRSSSTEARSTIQPGFWRI